MDRSWLPVLYVASELSTEWYLTGTKVGQFGGQILICVGWYEKFVTCETVTEMLKNAQEHDRNVRMWTSCKVAGAAKFKGVGNGVNY